MKRTLVVLALFAPPALPAADVEVARQLKLRDQRQLELTLQMQQHAGRATHPPTSLLADIRLRTLEQAQQQRLQALHDQQAREQIAPATITPADPRGTQTAADILGRMGAERQLNAP